MLGRIGRFFKLKALFPTSGIWAPSWAWLSFEPAHGCGSSWTRTPLLPLLCYSPIVLWECAGNNYADKLNIISIIKSVWWFVSIYKLVGIRSLFFFFLTQALQDPLGSGRSLSWHSQVTCFPFWVLTLEKLSSEFLHCPPRQIIAHHNHSNA